jgi:hypothetical protein
MTKLLKVDTLEDLQTYILKQKEFTEKAKRELQRVSDAVPVILGPDGTFSDSTTNDIIRRVTGLFHNYASLPTLTEYAQNPTLTRDATWGGSFGVSSVLGTVILRSLVESFPEFSVSVKPIFIKVMKELYSPEDGEDRSMMERVMDNLNFSIRDKGNKEILGEQRDRIIKNRVALLMEVIAKVMADYGLVEINKQEDNIETSITPLGIRVYLHIIDVERYINEMSTVYKELANKKAV